LLGKVRRFVRLSGFRSKAVLGKDCEVQVGLGSEMLRSACGGQPDLTVAFAKPGAVGL
jgi:hypothetical protein